MTACPESWRELWTEAEHFLVNIYSAFEVSQEWRRRDLEARDDIHKVRKTCQRIGIDVEGLWDDIRPFRIPIASRAPVERRRILSRESASYAHSLIMPSVAFNPRLMEETLERDLKEAMCLVNYDQRGMSEALQQIIKKRIYGFDGEEEKAQSKTAEDARRILNQKLQSHLKTRLSNFTSEMCKSADLSTEVGAKQDSFELIPRPDTPAWSQRNDDDVHYKPLCSSRMIFRQRHLEFTEYDCPAFHSHRLEPDDIKGYYKGFDGIGRNIEECAYHK